MVGVPVLTAHGALRRVPEDRPSIQEAIDASGDGDTVLVAAGLYRERIDFRGKSIRLIGESGASKTVLHGEGGGSVVTFASGEPSTAILEGFTIRGGSGQRLGSLTYGGGIFCSGSSPTIRANVIVDNSCDHGGAIACLSASSPQIIANEIRQNEAVRSAGGVFFELDSSGTVRENSFDGNAAPLGSVIHVTGASSPVIASNRIEGNTSGTASLYIEGASFAIVEGNAVLGNAEGGVVCKSVQQGLVQIRENRIEGNAGSGVLCSEGSSAVSVRSNIIRWNASTYGGGVSCTTGSSPSIAGNVIVGNEVSELGGGLYLGVECSPFVADNIIASNDANGRVLDGPGGGIYSALNAPLLLNNTISGNYANGGSGRWAGIGLGGRQGAARIVNCIIWGNHGADQIGFDDFWLSPVVTHCVVEGGWTGEGTGNLDSDPRFVDPNKADYHLRLGSPCVDSGDSSQGLREWDVEGDPRIVDGDADSNDVVDIGADELLVEFAVRFGTVTAQDGALFDPLRVNGHSGDGRRVLRVVPGEPIRIEMLGRPAGPVPARFACYAWNDEPDSTTISPQPYGLGLMSFPTFLAGGPLNLPDRVWNNLGRRKRLGHPDSPSSPAPTLLLELPAGLSGGERFTLQGFIEDLASGAQGPVSVTNAVVVRVE